VDNIRIVLPGGDDAAVAAVVSEVEKINTVEVPRSVADYHARFLSVLDPQTAASMQESVSVVQWTEHTPGAHPVANVMVKVWPQGRFPELRARVERLAAQAGGHVEYPYGDPFPAMVNSVGLSAAAGQYLSAALGRESVLWGRASWPFNCEDFALFLQQAPGAMFYLGVANAEAGMNGAPHTLDFAADERAIGHGVRAMAGLLAHRLAGAGEVAGPGWRR
jgi:hypothetical protein